MLNTEVLKQIDVAADGAFAYVADTIDTNLSPADVHKSARCRPVVDFMGETLRDEGVPVETVSRGGEGVDEHRYLKLGGTIIDATWQQFIPHPNSDDLPAVYIGSREGLQDLADLHGAEPWVAKLWDEHGIPRHKTVQERIADAYDAA